MPPSLALVGFLALAGRRRRVRKRAQVMHRRPEGPHRRVGGATPAAGEPRPFATSVPEPAQVSTT